MKIERKRKSKTIQYAYIHKSKWLMVSLYEKYGFQHIYTTPIKKNLNSVH